MNINDDDNVCNIINEVVIINDINDDIDNDNDSNIIINVCGINEINDNDE